MDSSLPFGGNLDLENTKLLPEVLKLHSGQWLVNTSAICSSTTTYWSFTAPLHHIPDIVILDLDELRLVMEHWIL